MDLTKSEMRNSTSTVNMTSPLQSFSAVVKTLVLVEQQRLAATKNAFDFNRRSLEILGLWPSTGVASRLKRCVRLLLPVFMILRICCIVAVEAMSIAQASTDTSMKVEFTIIIIFYVHCVVKYSCIYLRRERLRALFARIEELAATLVVIHRTNAAILRNTELMCYRVNRYPTGITFSVIAATLVWLAFHSLADKDLPFFSWFPYDAKSSPAYEVTLAVILSGFLFDLGIVVICDASGVISILQVEGLLHMLRNDIENAKQITKENARRVHESLENSRKVPSTSRTCQQDGGIKQCVDQVISRPLNGGAFKRLMAARSVLLSMGRMEKIMKTNVRHHQQIISLVKEVQDVFSPILTDQIIFNALLGIVGLYVSTLTKTTFVKSLVMASCIFGGVVELFFMCWSSDRLTLASVSVFEAAYSCDWLDESSAFKRSLRLLMTRAQKDLVLKAAGVTVSRRTFRTVCKVSYYFQSLLSKIYTRS